MARYILTRAFYSLITLWLLVTIVFGMVRLTGDTVKMYGEVGASVRSYAIDRVSSPSPSGGFAPKVLILSEFWGK